MSHAHLSDTFSLCGVRTSRVHARLKVFAVRMSYLSISPSLLSCLVRFPWFSLTVSSTPRSVCTVFVELYQIQKRGSSAPPHERREFGCLADPTHSRTIWPTELQKCTLRPLRSKTLPKKVTQTPFFSNFCHLMFFFFPLCGIRWTVCGSMFNVVARAHTCTAQCRRIVDPPPCLGGSTHRWVPVDTHSTPVPERDGCGWPM